MPTLVFVVDDEIIVASTLAAISSKNGFEARSFFRPLEALREAAIRSPGILISDVAMPEMSGIELGIQFKAKHPAYRFLLFSGHASSSGQLDEAYRLGHDFTLLTKPLHPADLHAVLNGVPPRTRMC